MDAIEEARDPIRRILHGLYLGEYGFFDHDAYQEAMRAVNAFALAVHVKACLNSHKVDDGVGHTESEYCGSKEWYCDKAKEQGLCTT